MSSRHILNINLGDVKYANPKRFWKEINYIAKRDSVSTSSIQVDDITFGYEPVFFIKGKWSGYLDHAFYREMEEGVTEDDIDSEWDEWNKYKSEH